MPGREGATHIAGTLGRGESKGAVCSRLKLEGCGLRFESGGLLEFDFGGVAEGVEDAEEEIRRDVLGVAVHDGGDAGARGTREAGDLSVRQALALNDFDNF